MPSTPIDRRPDRFKSVLPNAPIGTRHSTPAIGPGIGGSDVIGVVGHPQCDAAMREGLSKFPRAILSSMSDRPQVIRIAAAAATVLVAAGLADQARATCMEYGTYGADVQGCRVRISRSALWTMSRPCPDPGGMLRQNIATGEVVRLASECSPADAQPTYVDDCVPPGVYRYGLARPFAPGYWPSNPTCSNTCGMPTCTFCRADYFVTVTVPASDGGCDCDGGLPAPMPVDGAPWGECSVACSYLAAPCNPPVDGGAYDAMTASLDSNTDANTVMDVNTVTDVSAVGSTIEPSWDAAVTLGNDVPISRDSATNGDVARGPLVDARFRDASSADAPGNEDSPRYLSGRGCTVSTWNRADRAAAPIGVFLVLFLAWARRRRSSSWLPSLPQDREIPDRG